MRFGAILAILPAAAFGVAVESLPQFEYADTEVSTNIPFAVSFDAMSRMNFSISLDASPSNCVEVSIGEDADGTVRAERMFLLRKRKIDEAWNLVKVTRRGKAEIGEVMLVKGKKPGAALIVR